MMNMNSISAIFPENTKIFFWEKSMTSQEFWGEIHFKTYPRFGGGGHRVKARG
jgi:hypothetical protein